MGDGRVSRFNAHGIDLECRCAYQAAMLGTATAIRSGYQWQVTSMAGVTWRQHRYGRSAPGWLSRVRVRQRLRYTAHSFFEPELLTRHRTVASRDSSADIVSREACIWVHVGSSPSAPEARLAQSGGLSAASGSLSSESESLAGPLPMLASLTRSWHAGTASAWQAPRARRRRLGRAEPRARVQAAMPGAAWPLRFAQIL